MDSSQVKALLEENNLVVHYMSGTSSMLPTQFNYQPKNITKRVHQAEKTSRVARGNNQLYIASI